MPMSHASVYIPARSRLVATRPPSPVRSRARSLATTPAAIVSPVTWSPIPLRNGGGSSPGGTIEWARPLRAQNAPTS